jgi:hypothetical protein
MVRIRKLKVVQAGKRNEMDVSCRIASICTGASGTSKQDVGLLSCLAALDMMTTFCYLLLLDQQTLAVFRLVACMRIPWHCLTDCVSSWRGVHSVATASHKSTV